MHIIFIITSGLERTSELFYWIRGFLPFTVISELGIDLILITWTRLCLNVFGSINFDGIWTGTDLDINWNAILNVGLLVA